jgi:ribonucleotide reductase alpha subunit
MFSAERLKLKQMSEKSNVLKLDLWSYFQGSLDFDALQQYGWDQCNHIILKADIPMHIEANQTYIDSNLQKAYQKEKVDFLEAIIKSLNNRGFNINAAVQWEKFKVGI